VAKKEQNRGGGRCRFPRPRLGFFTHRRPSPCHNKYTKAYHHPEPPTAPAKLYKNTLFLDTVYSHSGSFGLAPDERGYPLSIVFLPAIAQV
jgi:hypothetical protein